MSGLSRSFSLLVCLVLIFSALPIPAQTTIQHGVPWQNASAPSGSAPVGAHLSYFGGPVVSNAHIVQVLYGTGSYNPQVAGTSSPTMGSFFGDLLGINSGYINLLSQYSTNFSGGTNQIIGNGTFDGLFQIVPSAGNNGSTINDSNIQAEILAQINAGHLPVPVLDAAGNVNTIYMIYFPPGKTITEGGLTSCVAGGFCAYHGTTSNTLNSKHLLYGVLPDMQAGSGCSTGCGASSVFGNYTSVTSHELSETITDADVGIATSFAAPLAWYDRNNGEIGDICNAQQGSYTANGITYTIQLEFSNAANNCVLPPAAIASLSPTSLSFGNQNVGTTSAAQTVTLSNSGTATLTITSISITGSSDFSSPSNNCGTSLAAGASCVITVIFTPTMTGLRTGTLSVNDNSVLGSPQTVSLSGTGIAPAVCLSSTSLSFGNQFVGTSSQPQTITVTNCGTAMLAINSITINGDFTQTNVCPASLAAGASCTIQVTFTPTAMGTRTGTLCLTDNAPGSPQCINLTGTGIAPVVNFSPTSLSFGNQNVGTTSPAQTVILSNSGTATLAISSISTSGDFAQTNNCGTSLAAGTSCAILVTFMPTALGTREGTLTVTDNAFGSPQQTTSLSGEGTTATQIARTWVSSTGSDANLCTRTAPCATFARALAQTLPGGEIDVVDPGSYGPVTIGQSLTIEGGGNQAGYLQAGSGNGIVIQAGANDVVTLRNLQIDGNGSGANGIRFLRGKNLSIEGSHIFGFTQNGIDIEVNSASTVQITDTVVKNSGNDGIFATSTSGLVRVAVSNSQIMASSNNGIEGSTNGFATVHYSLISASGGSGAIAGGTNGCGSVGIDNSDIVGGNNGVTAANGCFLNIGHSHLGYNITGVAYNQAGGTILAWTRGAANASNSTNIIHDHTSVGTATYITEQ